MAEHVHRLELQGRDVTLTWVGQAGIEPTRVYALAFVSAREMLLVSGGPDDPDRWLPGGGIKPGETPEEALQRELLEEADAEIITMEDLGSQRIDDPQGGQEYHRFYWCRVNLLQQDQPRVENTLRHIISPTDFLDLLEWGRSDPKAAMLLERALDAELRYENYLASIQAGIESS